MKINNRFLLTAFIGLLITQSCSKKDPVLPKLPPIYHQDGDISKVMFNRPDGVNIVFLGDGFTKEDLKENGKFDTQVKKLSDFFFSIEPFKQYKKYFNVYQVYAESKVSGAGNYYIPDRTKFDAYFGTLTNEYLVTGNYDASYQYASKAVPVNEIALLVMLVNDDRYGGTGGSIATVSTGDWAEYTLVHEAGHSFAGLADEYINESISANYTLDMLPYLANVDNTSDLRRIKWAHLLEHPTYRPQLGAFEGGYYRNEGIFRPEENSIMRNIGTAWFNAPSREAIVKTIHSRMAMPYNLNEFIRDDAKNLQKMPLTSNVKIPPLYHDFLDIKQRTIQLHEMRHRVVPLK
jgi:hypothetical protein